MPDKVLLVEDNALNTRKIMESLQEAGFQMSPNDHIVSYHNFLDRWEKKELQEYDIGIFDIRLSELDEHNIDGIHAAAKFNEERPRPTIFVTAYDHSDFYFNETERQVGHSVYFTKNGDNWSKNVVQQIGKAKKLLGSFSNLPEPENLDTISISLIPNIITFRVNADNRRIFLRKDNILYIDYRNPLSVFITNIPSISDTTTEFAIYASLASVDRQLKSYTPFGWHFRKVSGNCIVNLEKCVSFDASRQFLTMEGEKGVTTSPDLINNRVFEDWYPYLTTRQQH